MGPRRRIALTTIAVASALAAVTTAPAQAASRDECAIWLCLPAGFPAGCGAAHSAMINRIEHRKSPLPSFSACAVEDEGGSNMSYDYSVAALIPKHRRCIEHGSGRYGRASCEAYETVPRHHVKNTRCRRNPRFGTSTPAGCVRTDRYVDVFIDGRKAGNTYFW